MKKLLVLYFLAHLPSSVLASEAFDYRNIPTSSKIKIVNQRRHKLLLGELSRVLENSTTTLNRYKQQHELNKTLSARSHIVPKKSDLQKHLAAYKMLKNIYDEYKQTKQLLIPLELLTDLVQDETLLTILLTEAAEHKRIEHEVTTMLVDEDESITL